MIDLLLQMAPNRDSPVKGPKNFHLIHTLHNFWTILSTSQWNVHNF